MASVDMLGWTPQNSEGAKPAFASGTRKVPKASRVAAPKVAPTNVDPAFARDEPSILIPKLRIFLLSRSGFGRFGSSASVALALALPVRRSHGCSNLPDARVDSYSCELAWLFGLEPCCFVRERRSEAFNFQARHRVSWRDAGMGFFLDPPV